MHPEEARADLELHLNRLLTMSQDPPCRNSFADVETRRKQMPMREITATEATTECGATGPTLGRDARLHIGRELQAVFAMVEGEPIPNDQIDLLLALRRKERETARQER
jgi:hypothetical protein